MTDRRDGLVAGILKGVLLVCSFFYGIASSAIKYIKSLSAKRLPCRVISIGNLTLGGTGKTPAACMVAKAIKHAAKRPCVLIRGYGDDEWRMLEEQLGNIPMIVGKDRVSSGIRACSRLNSDTVILDDGFQHWRVKRDMDIVLIDSTNPFGNNHLFPRGIMREDIKGLRRADIIMLTKTDMAGKGRVRDIKEKLNNPSGSKPVVESIHAPVGFYNLDNREREGLSVIKDKKVCSLSGIVNNEYFEYTLKSLGADIALKLHYPDHYNYKETDLQSIIKRCKDLGIDTVVTTEKDAAKLKNTVIARSEATKQSGMSQIRILALQIELKVTDGKEILDKRLHTLYSS